MAQQAEAAGIPVSMGYNKNVAKYASPPLHCTALHCFAPHNSYQCTAPHKQRGSLSARASLQALAPLSALTKAPLRRRYVAEARAAEASAGSGAVTTFIHNNAYKPEELDECFERNSEGSE